jgi:hypothetical protein
MPSTRLGYAWMRTSVSLWFDDSLAVVMLDALTGALNTTFFVVVFLVGCFEFAFMVSLLSLFFSFGWTVCDLTAPPRRDIPRARPLRL